MARPFWRHYYANTQGVIFVVDSSDSIGIDDARDELHKMIGDEELKDVPILILANKQDVTGAMITSEVSEKLALNTIKGKNW